MKLLVREIPPVSCYFLSAVYKYFLTTLSQTPLVYHSHPPTAASSTGCQTAPSDWLPPTSYTPGKDKSKVKGKGKVVPVL
jgi:hypothetical protein